MSNETKYKVMNGTAFHTETPDEVCAILNSLLHTGHRVKIYLGDPETGRDWHEEYDTIGTIGRSTGTYKVPLLIHSIRSMGGGAILDHCIVKIKSMATKRVLYQNPKYQAPNVEITPSDLDGYQYYTLINGELHGRHRSLKCAQMCAAKLR